MSADPRLPCERVRTAEDVAAEAAAIYGAELPRQAGVLHVASVWRSPRDELFSLRIGPASPPSPTDAFVLALARARADAIVTTGKILREEPALRFEAAEPLRSALAAWRRERMGLGAPPFVVVLTGGQRFDPAHPALVPHRTWIVTGRAAADELAAGAAQRGLELFARDEPGLLDVLAWLREERGLRTLSVEAGPDTASALYAGPGRLDESLLSICHAPELAAGVRGARVPGAAERARIGLAEVSRCVREEPSGAWTFLRFTRAGTP